MSFEQTSCPHCGSDQTLYIDRSIDAGVVSEADCHCGKCLRHLYYYAYGYTQEGSGELPNEVDTAELRRQQRQREENEEYACRMDELASELHDASGQPIGACLTALHDARGKRDLALAGLLSNQAKVTGSPPV